MRLGNTWQEDMLRESHKSPPGLAIVHDDNIVLGRDDIACVLCDHASSPLVLRGELCAALSRSKRNWQQALKLCFSHCSAQLHTAS